MIIYLCYVIAYIVSSLTENVFIWEKFNFYLCKTLGKIQLILGPMFSGKSTELIRRLKRFQVAKYDVLIVKYAKDVRYDEYGISTHDRQTLPAVAATSLTELTETAKTYDVIGIDEGQFFPDVAWAEDMANIGKVVLIAALDGTYQRKPFQNIMNLVPLAENITKLK